MQEQGYDALSQDLSDILADTELEIKTNAEKQLAVIDSMLTHTVNKYADAYGKINEIIKNTGFVGSNEFNQATEDIATQAGAQAQKEIATSAQSETSSSASVNGIDTSKIATKDTTAIENAINTPEQTTNRPVNQIELSHSSVSVLETNTVTVKVNKILPSDAKNKTVTWQSSDTKIATVSGGTIKGVKPGSCTITATAADGHGASATVSVTVTALPQPSTPATPTPTTPSSPTTNTSTSSSNGKGDGKVKKGEKVTFASGKYTASSDGSGASGKQKLGKSVYVAKVKSGAKRPYLLSTDKAGKHLLGWVKKSQLKGYASGSKYIDEEQFAWTQEQGSEIITLPDGSVLTKLPKGAGVIPHNLTENLWGLANSAEDIMANTVGKTMKLINNVVNNGGNTVNYHYDSLLTVNGDVDKAVLPELKEILKQSYQYTTQQMTKDALRGGNKLRR